MAQKLNITLSLTADATQAKAQIKLLQTELKKLSETGGGKSGTMLGLTKEVNDAISKVNELRAVLNKATDAITGKLDLSRFNQALMKSGTSLKQYRDSLLALGPQGQKAFTQLATSIANADARILKAHGTMKAMLTTLGNTLRWTVAAGAIHTFTGSIQTALGYAQDLDKSLNKIRIVSGQSAQQMADFAAQANKAAQALSTTTTAYTDAALIFFQAGLSGEEVTKRTETVIKMAQVTGDSVEEVSSYMTAVWNNFDNGSKSLEYYADVIAQLGAKTAASSSEISQGLEKFAAVAETAGLSYEYATSALATVVATTRQSADTVGTAFKTLFARIQDLELGKTLDDGTTLGKYSQALESVGVNIKDVNGDLKDMDTILDELGARWGTLGNDIQVAVAQAVGGTRQYNQLMSLMENWDVMKQNVEYAREAEGTVQRQADIYAESWEAAQKRIKAASQEIYDSLIDEKFFISVDDTITKLLKGTAGLIQNLGGVQGVISTLAAFILSKFNGEIATGIDNLIIKFKDAKQDADSIRTNAVSLAMEGYKNNPNTTQAEKIANELLEDRLNLQLLFIQNSKKMTEEQKEIARIQLDSLNDKRAEVVAQQEIIDKLHKEYELLKLNANFQPDADPTRNFTAEEKAQVKAYETEINKINKDLAKKNIELDNRSQHSLAQMERYKEQSKSQEKKDAWDQEIKKVKELQQAIENLKKTREDYEKRQADYIKQRAPKIDTTASQEIDRYKKEALQLTHTKTFGNILGSVDYKATDEEIQHLTKVFEGFEKLVDNTGTDFNEFFGEGIAATIEELENLIKTDPQNIEQISKLLQQIRSPGQDLNLLGQQFTENMSKKFGMDSTEADEIVENINKITQAEEQELYKRQEVINLTNILRETLEGYSQQVAKTGQKVAASVQAFSTFSMTLNTLSGSIKTLTSDDAGGIQKLSALLMIVTGVIKTLNAVTNLSTILTKANTKAKTENTAATKAQNTANQEANEKTESLVKKFKALPIGLQIATAALLALTAAFEIYRNMAIKTAEADIKRADASLEVTEKSREELEAQQDLYKAYKEAYDTYQETGEGKQALIEAATKAANAYNAEGAAIAILTNDYSKLNEELEKLNDANLKAILESDERADAALRNRSSAIAAKQSAEKWDLFGILGNFINPFNKADEGSTLATAEALNKTYGNIVDEWSIGLRNQAALNLSGSALDIVEKYDAILATGNATLIQALDDWDETYNKALEQVKTQRQDTANVLALSVKGATDFKQYKAERDKAFTEIEKFGKEGKDALTNALVGTKEGSVFEALAQAFDQHANWEKVYEAIKPKDTGSFISFMNLFPDLTPAQAEERWEQYRDAIEAAQEGKEIRLKFTAAEGALESLKEKMSDSEWTKFFEDHADLGWSEEFKNIFKTYTFEEQEAYLEKLKGNSEDVIQAILKEIEGKKQIIENLKKDTLESDADWITIAKKLTDTETEIDQLYQDLAIATRKAFNESSEAIKEYRKELDSLKEGDTISVELVTYLRDIGVDNLEKYLSYMGDGTYRLVNAAEEFVKVTKEASFESSIEENQKNINNIKQLQKFLTENSIDNYANYLAQIEEKRQQAEQNNNILTAQDLRKDRQRDFKTLKDHGLMSSREYNENYRYFTTEDDEKYKEYSDKRKAELEKDIKDLQDKIQVTTEEVIQGTAFWNEFLGINDFQREQLPNKQKELSLWYNEDHARESGLYKQNLTEISPAELNTEAILTKYTEDLETVFAKAGVIISEEFAKGSQEWIDEGLRQLANKQKDTLIQYANSLTTFDELDNFLKKFGDTQDGIDAYSKAWNNLNDQLERTNVDAQKLTEYTEHLLEIADDADQELISRFIDKDLAEDIAKEVLRMNSGLEALTSNFEKWNDVLQNSSKTSQEYAAALEGLRAAAADLFDVNKDFISSEFLVDPDNLTAFQEAVNGNGEAIDSLKAKLTESIVQGFDITDGLKTGLNNAIAAIQQDLATLKIGGEVNPEFLHSLEDAAKKANLTATEFEALADAMGIDVEYTLTKVEIPHEGIHKTHEMGNVTVGDHGGLQWEEWEKTDTYPLPSTFEEIPAWSTNGDKPSIKTATKKATGVMANNSSLNKGGNVSSPKKPVKGDKSQFKTEVERYHEINKVLEDMERKLKRIENVKSKAFGPDKIKAIKDEVGMLNAENKAYEERLREANEYLQMDRAKVLGLGAQLDENGIITNYSQVAASLNNQYNQGYVEYINAQNAAIAAYNQTGNQDAYDKALDAINEKWKAVQQLNKENVDALKQYEDTIKQIEEDEIKLEELKQQKYEAEIEEIEVRVNLKVSLSETQMKRIDFQLKLLGDDIDKATDRILKYGETADAQVLNAGAAEEGIRRILSHAGADEDLINRYMTTGLTEEDLSGLKLTEKDVELLEGYTDKLISAYGTIMEQQKKVWEEVDKVLQETTDEFEKLDATFERISKRLGSYQNIINTVGKNILDPTGELTKAIATAQIDISKESALNRKNQLDTYKSQAEDLRKAIAEGTQKGTKEEAENRLKEMEKTISETENLYLEEINNLAEAWKTSFDLANQQIFKDFEKQATGAAGSFEFLNMQYDFVEELADQVVPEYERIYDLSKLTRDITNSINDGKLIAGNEKLAQLQDDITAEMNKQEMSSKYSLDYLRMRYELLLAEMQLEEARNNKTSLKLKRDSQGNYSYQYGVDEDAINNAQQNYEDKLYAMQKFNDDFIQEQQKLLATIPEQMTQALAALDPGDPQYDEKRQAIIDHYQKLYDTVAENLQRALGNQRTLYLQDWSAYNEATGYKISSEEKFMDTFGKTLLSQTTGYKDLGDLRAAFTAATLSENEALTDSHNRYTEGIKNDLEECGLDTQKFSEIVYTALGQANKEIAETGRISDETREKFSAMSTSVIADATKTSDEIEIKAKTIAAAAEAAVSSLEKFRKKAVELADSINSIPNSFERNYKLVYTTVYNTEGKEFDTSSFGDSGQGGNKSGQELRDSAAAYRLFDGKTGQTLNMAGTYSALVQSLFDEQGNWIDPNGTYGIVNEKTGEVKAISPSLVSQYPNAKKYKSIQNFILSEFLQGFDTGGYTGNWNSSEGRLAMLHQKELVLNASDTSNMLEMVSAVRDLAGAAQANVAGNIAQMIADNIASALYNTTTINNGMQQQVTINADFPAATSAYEIETALNSLVNKATQRAGISQNYR